MGLQDKSRSWRAINEFESHPAALLDRHDVSRDGCGKRNEMRPPSHDHTMQQEDFFGLVANRSRKLAASSSGVCIRAD